MTYDDLAAAKDLDTWLSRNSVSIEELRDAVGLVSVLDGLPRSETILGLFRGLIASGQSKGARSPEPASESKRS